MDLVRTVPRPCWQFAITLLLGTVPGTVVAQSDASALRPADSATIEPASWAWGSERAIIEVVEFTDFGCTYCARFDSESFGTLFTEYVELGKARWVFVPFASGRFPGASEATAFAICASEQGRDISSLRGMLFDRQAEWSSANTGATLRAYATELGLDARAYMECASSEQTTARIRENGRRATAAGVRGTPSIFVDGFPVMGALPTDFYRKLFDRTINRVQRGRRVSTSSTPLPASLP